MGPIQGKSFTEGEEVNESICQEAHRITNTDRNEDYGHPLDDFSHAAEIISAILQREISPEEIPLIQIGIKLARESNKHKRDNLVDIAGYANTMQMLLDEQEKRLADNGIEPFTDRSDVVPPGRKTAESSINQQLGGD